MRTFEYIEGAEKYLTPEVVLMLGSIHENKGKQEMYLEMKADVLETHLFVTSWD